jgi:hypothetical protein
MREEHYCYPMGMALGALAGFGNEYFRQKDGARRDLQLNLLRLGRAVPWTDFAPQVDWMTYSRDPLDVALAWHVADLLGGCTQLTLHFAEQLEMLGCWEWAVYVLGLHEEHLALQEEVVARHVSARAAQLEPAEVFVVPLVGKEMVWSAKAVKAQFERSYVVAALCFKEVPAPDHVTQLLLEHIIASAMSALDGATALEPVKELLTWLDGQPIKNSDSAAAVALFRQHLMAAPDSQDGHGLMEAVAALLEQRGSRAELRACARDVQRHVSAHAWANGSYEEELDALIAAA